MIPPFLPCQPPIIHLCELLLDEERSKVGELPGASDAEGGELDEHPADDTTVGGFGLISELGFAFLRENTCQYVEWLLDVQKQIA